MVEALQRHLSAFAELSDNDHALIASLASRNLREAAPRRDIVREGEKPSGVLCILEGWAAVYKQLPDGRRQITAFLIPGDLAEATGLTSVHVNRTLQQMRRDGLIELQGRRLTIPDLRALMRVALFDPDYLHLEAPPA